MIPPRVNEFVAEQIGSVAQLEILLHLHAHPDRDFSAAEIAGELRIGSNWAEPQLEELCARGLIACKREAGPS